VPVEFTNLVNSQWWGFYKMFLQEKEAEQYVKFLNDLERYQGGPTWDLANSILRDYIAGGVIASDLDYDTTTTTDKIIDALQISKKKGATPPPTVFEEAYKYILLNVVGGFWSIKKQTKNRSAFIKWLQEEQKLTEEQTGW